MIVMYCVKNVYSPSLLLVLLFLWESIHSSAFYVAFSMFFSSPYLINTLIISRTLAVCLAMIINCGAALVFQYLYQLNSLIPLTIFPGGAYSLFMMQSLVMRYEALSLILQALSYSVVSTIVYIVICYVVIWLREDLLNVMDHVSMNEENDS